VPQEPLDGPAGLVGVVALPRVLWDELLRLVDNEEDLGGEAEALLPLAEDPVDDVGGLGPGVLGLWEVDDEDPGGALLGGDYLVGERLPGGLFQLLLGGGLLDDLAQSVEGLLQRASGRAGR
jgi:hypothetical protein